VVPEVPEMVRGDSSRLRQIASTSWQCHKFTNQGEVALKVKSDAEEGENLLLHFTVADTGCWDSQGEARINLSTLHAGGCVDDQGNSEEPGWV